MFRFFAILNSYYCCGGYFSSQNFPKCEFNSHFGQFRLVKMFPTTSSYRSLTVYCIYIQILFLKIYRKPDRCFLQMLICDKNQGPDQKRGVWSEPVFCPSIRRVFPDEIKYPCVTIFIRFRVPLPSLMVKINETGIMRTYQSICL